MFSESTLKGKFTERGCDVLGSSSVGHAWCLMYVKARRLL